MQSDNEHLKTFRAIRGAPATILLLLFVRGISMTNREICQFTGYSDKPVTAATGLLESLGFLQYNGHLHGWSLRAGAQLPLPLGEGYPQVEASYPQPVDKMIGISPMIGNSPINSPTTTTTIDTLESYESQSSRSSKSNGHDRNFSDDRKNSDQPQDDPDTDDPDTAENGHGIPYWLRRAGVGAASRKYRQLCAADLDEYTVRAHTLERLANPSRISVGLYIRKLEDGDPAPPERCPDCYKPLDEFGYCRNLFCPPDQDDNEE